jgi:hypothetical protein
VKFELHLNSIAPNGRKSYYLNFWFNILGVLIFVFMKSWLQGKTSQTFLPKSAVNKNISIFSINCEFAEAISISVAFSGWFTSF